MTSEASRSMRVARIVKPETIRIDEAPLPKPGPGEVRIRLEGSGVCASNLGPWKGLPWQRYPMAPGAAGHEGWGVIDAIGEGVDERSLGQRVAALSQAAYAEYDVASSEHVVQIPEEMRHLPFPGEAFGCALNVFRRSRVEPGQTVAIVGIGFLGAALTRLASRVGARVLAISRRPFALDMSRRMGADHALEMGDSPHVLAEVEAITKGKLCDRVIEAAGVQASLDLASKLVRERGTLIVAGYHQDGPREVNMQMWNWRGLDVVNAHERDPAVYVRGIREAIAVILRKDLDPLSLITHRFPLEDLDRALDATAERPEGFLKAVVTL